MDKHDVEWVKRSHNIVDVVGRYVPLRKAGKDYQACCPFHSEKTPSFTVSESRQFYHCFGCGAGGDVLDFVMNYAGMDFLDAYKELGGELDLKPAEEVIKNQRQSYAARDKLPPDHKQDGDKAAKYLGKCIIENIGGVDFHRYKNGFMLPVYTARGEIVNAAIFTHGEPMYFAAGGFSYNGFTPIRLSDDDRWLVCVSLADGRYLANHLNVNVAVCWDAHAMKYLCKWNYGDLKFKPVITPHDDDYLCYEMGWISFDNYKMEKRKCL